MNELIKKLEILFAEVTALKTHLNLSEKKQRLLELGDAMQVPGFWADNITAQKTAQEYTQLKNFLEFWEKIEADCLELLELVKNNRDESSETLLFLTEQATYLTEKYRQNRIIALLNKKYDDHNAIFSVHSGAGGLDAQDWAEMLLRMLMRFCQKKGFNAEILEMNKGQEGGIKSAVVSVKGPFAYGYLKSEAGVHRLVRLSPFNPAHTRETSFALIELLPELNKQEELKIEPKDLKIEANTSSGHGGQSVNTTYSAIRITHIPTGIKVSIQNERSQHQNRDLAMKILMSKLKTLEEEKFQREKKEIRGEFKSAEWGNQIRSYVIHPYKLVKDHRTDYESTSPFEVLEGDLDDFVEKYLERLASSTQ